MEGNDRSISTDYNRVMLIFCNGDANLRLFFMAEREGVEPSEHLVGIHAISSRAPSATRASLLYNLLKLHHECVPGQGDLRW